MSSADQATLIVRGYDDVKAALGSNDLSRSIDFERFERGNIDEDTLIMLHGDAHRHRRRVENQLFRRDMFEKYERDLFPQIVEHTISSFVDDAAVDLMELGGLFTVVLAARTAGIDFDWESSDDRRKLRNFLHEFAYGGAINTATEAPEVIKARMRTAMAAFREQYFDRSAERRRQLLRQVEEGSANVSDLPLDALTTLLQHQSELDITDDIVARETGMFFTAGAHTSTQTIANSLHLIFDWVQDRPEDWPRLRDDLAFAQRCVHEGLRIRPTNPVIQRRALRDTQIGSMDIPEGTVLTLDTVSANHDTSVYGADASEFNPDRTLPPKAPSWGLSFGHGMHLCIGRTLAVGLPQASPDELGDAHLFGLIPIAVQDLVRRGVQPDRMRRPEPDTRTKRWTRWMRYPVVLEGEMTQVAKT